MLVSCGIDVEEISRFDRYLSQPPEQSAFLRLVCHPDEIQHLKSDPERGFPLAFCAKEAVFKSLDRSWTNSLLDWKEIQLRMAGDRVQLHFSGAVNLRLNELGVNRWETNHRLTDEFAMFSILLYR